MHFGPIILLISFWLKTFVNKNITFLKLILFLSIFSTIGFINIGTKGIGIDKAIVYIVVLLFFFNLLDKQCIKVSKKYIIYSFFVIFTIALPLICNREIERFFISPSGITSETISSLSIYSISKSLEMLFPIIFYGLILNLSKYNRAESVYNVLYFGVFLVSLTGLVDYFPHAIDIWKIIKTNIAYPTVVAGVVTKAGYFRLSGLTAEPSHLVVFATIGLNMTIVNLFNKRFKFKYVLFFCLFLFISIKTYSPSFYLLLIPAIFYIWYKNKLIKHKLIILFVLLLSFMFLYLTGYVDAMIKGILIRTGSSSVEDSSKLRILSYIYAFNVFANHPILGVGFGNFLLPVGFPALVLASAGLLGLFVMFFLLIKYIQYVKRSYLYYDTDTKYVWYSFFINAIGLILMGLFTKGFQIFLHVPYILILALPLCNFNKSVTTISDLKLRSSK